MYRRPSLPGNERPARSSGLALVTQLSSHRLILTPKIRTRTTGSVSLKGSGEAEWRHIETQGFLSFGRFFQMSAELEAHSREQFVLEICLAA
jgi:hypothetical protein